jgi:adenine-specific DNA methylase
MRASTEIPETYKGLYAMHKYWSKKPHNLVANYIERFSAPNDIVIDSFCGSGVTVIESVRLRRRAIGFDINPIALLITDMGLTQIDIQQLKACFNAIQHDLAPLFGSLYRTACLKCGNPNALMTHTIWEKDRPQEIWYTCPQCRTRKDIKPASEDDLKAANDPPKLSGWYPTDELVVNSRINARPGMRVSDLFTQRAIVGLAALFERLQQVQDEKIRVVMEFCFSAALPQASNLVFVIRRRGKTTNQVNRGKAEVGSWVIGYWMPVEHFEINVWRCFESRFERIIKGKQEVNTTIPTSVVKCASFEELSQVKEGYWTQTGTATELPLPDNQVDYAFIDPPHGNRIPYLELSLIWNAWLGLKNNWEDEIIISEAKNRQKDILDYRRRLMGAFNELWRVLKPDKCISIAFNTLDDETWLSLLEACLEAGFELLEIKPLAYSARSVVQDNRKNALKTDFVITCKKRVPKKVNPIQLNDSDDYHPLKQEISDCLAHLEEGAETYQILNHLYITDIPTERIFRVSQILKVLENEFTSVDGRWYLNISARIRNERFKS